MVADLATLGDKKRCEILKMKQLPPQAAKKNKMLTIPKKKWSPTLPARLALTAMPASTSSLLPYCLTHLAAILKNRKQGTVSHDIVLSNTSLFGGAGAAILGQPFLFTIPFSKTGFTYCHIFEGHMNCRWSTTHRDKSFHRE